MLDDSYSLLVRALEYHFRPRLRTRRPAASEFQALPWSTEAEMAELYVAVASKDNLLLNESHYRYHSITLRRVIVTTGRRSLCSKAQCTIYVDLLYWFHG